MNQADNNTYAIASLTILVTRAVHGLTMASAGVMTPEEVLASMEGPWTEADMEMIVGLYRFENQDKENFEKLLDRLKQTW